MPEGLGFMRNYDRVNAQSQNLQIVAVAVKAVMSCLVWGCGCESSVQGFPKPCTLASGPGLGKCLSV